MLTTITSAFVEFSEVEHPLSGNTSDRIGLDLEEANQLLEMCPPGLRIIKTWGGLVYSHPQYLATSIVRRGGFSAAAMRTIVSSNAFLYVEATANTHASFTEQIHVAVVPPTVIDGKTYSTRLVPAQYAVMDVDALVYMQTIAESTCNGDGQYLIHNLVAQWNGLDDAGEPVRLSVGHAEHDLRMLCESHLTGAICQPEVASALFRMYCDYVPRGLPLAMLLTVIPDILHPSEQIVVNATDLTDIVEPTA